MPLRILIADDHPIVRQGLRLLLEREGFDVVAEATTGSEAVTLAQRTRPDVAVLDLVMPRLNGLDAARDILQLLPGTGIVLLTIRAEEHQVACALRSGVRGYLLKTQAADVLVRAIGEVAQGRTVLSSAISDLVVGRYLAGERAPDDPLTPREREVLQLVAEGSSSKEIAVLLGLSVKTAESYRTRVMARLGIHQTAGLVRYAVRRGLITP